MGPPIPKRAIQDTRKPGHELEAAQKEVKLATITAKAIQPTKLRLRMKDTMI